jgi:predicted DNA-binding protein with PD1-like motif
MKKFIIAVMMLATSATGAFAQKSANGETRKEITTPAAPTDSKPNNPEVPDVYSIPVKFERVLVLRFKFDTDLLAGLEKAVKQDKIKNAVILSGIGSVRSYHIHEVSNRDFPSKDTFVQNEQGPADLVSVNGYVINGRVHAHVTLANPDKAFGGHLEPGTKVFTFAIVTVGVLDDHADLSRVDDKTYR